MSETVMLLLAGAIPAFIAGFTAARRWPRLLADPRPQILIPWRRDEFRPPGVRTAPHNHRDQWLWWTSQFIRTVERVGQARNVPPERVPSLRTLEAWGMPRRTARRYVVALARAGIVEIRQRAGAYWLLRNRAARWSALAGQSFSDEQDRPPRFKWQ